MKPPSQRIVRIRRDYNSWVATEMLEDYALRFAPRSFRTLTEWQVAGTALGSVSFLALEAIGGTVIVRYGFTNAVLAILVAGLVMFLAGLPISYYAARYNVDIDLLARGAGFGYIGSTITSLIYASFTFIFFAIEAAIMALMLELYFGLPLAWGYLVCSVAIVPMVAFGVTFISRFQLWTFPIWMPLSVLPFIAIGYASPEFYPQWATFKGQAPNGLAFDGLAFGAAMTICLSLIAQIGEQVDFLRFLPERRKSDPLLWWGAMLAGGPGWVIPGVLKQLAGSFLAFVVVQHELGLDAAVEPTQMYLVAFGYLLPDPAWALFATLIFVLLSQVKINLTNAYAGSLAWSNFFSRLTHSHPGRVVWLIFNVALAILLMELGVFRALEEVLSIFSCIAIAWVGALVADLVINKPLGLSPASIEFRRAHLHDVNPVGTLSTLAGSLSGIAAHAGWFGVWPQAFASLVALFIAIPLVPLIAWVTGGRYYLARPDSVAGLPAAHLECCICSNRFEREDMALCPAYAGPICSLCCTLDARCEDLCKRPVRNASSSDGEEPGLRERPRRGPAVLRHYLVVVLVFGGAVSLLFAAYTPQLLALSAAESAARDVLRNLWLLLLGFVAVAAWWAVLNRETRIVAQEESRRQTMLLLNEIDEHRKTDAALQAAKEVAEAASQAKSRFLSDMSHEVRNPLNSIIGYARRGLRDSSLPEQRRRELSVIAQSGEHVGRLFDDILDLARIEAGKFELHPEEVHLLDLCRQVVQMFRPQADARGLVLSLHMHGRIPGRVRVDELRLRQVLINLVSNAIKFTSAGEVRLRIDCARELTLFQVVDSGPGVPSEDMGRIFDAFQRGRNAPAEGTSGVGLGLTISRMLVDLMGGALEVRNNPSGGATFQFRLFLPEVRGSSTQPAEQLAELPDGYSGPRRRVLIVDDQESQRETLRVLLEDVGFMVDEAGDGDACLMSVARQSPDLILLDLVMPGRDGLSTLQALDTAGIGVPVVLVTANPAPEPGPYRGYIRKPVNELLLLQTIGRLLDLDWSYVDSGCHSPRRGTDHAGTSADPAP